jgi:hypothetical protein
MIFRQEKSVLVFLPYSLVIPHMGKERLLRQGMLPVCLHVSANAVSVVRQVLDVNE